MQMPLTGGTAGDASEAKHKMVVVVVEGGLT